MNPLSPHSPCRLRPPAWVSWVGWVLFICAVWSTGFLGGLSAGVQATSETGKVPAGGALPRMRAIDGIPLPWETSVRVRVDYGQSFGIGSGTVVRGDVGRSVVLTCAHLFRARDGSYGSPKAFARPVRVDLYGKPHGPAGDLRAVETLTATVLDYDPVRDVGLLGFAPKLKLRASPVAPADWRGEPGAPLVSVGCSDGEDPTAWAHALRGEIRGSGPYRAVVVTPKPVPGRSGGGLFALDCQLVGVCNSARVDGPEGYYAAPTSVRFLADRAGVDLVVEPDKPDAEISPGQVGRPAHPSPQAQAPPLAPPALALPPSWLEREAGVTPGQAKLGGLLALLAWWFRRRLAPAPASAARPPVPTLGPWDAALQALEAAAVHEARAAEANKAAADRSALLAEIKAKVAAAVSPTLGPKASGAPSAV